MTSLKPGGVPGFLGSAHGPVLPSRACTSRRDLSISRWMQSCPPGAPAEVGDCMNAESQLGVEEGSGRDGAGPCAREGKVVDAEARRVYLEGMYRRAGLGHLGSMGGRVVPMAIQVVEPEVNEQRVQSEVSTAPSGGNGDDDPDFYANVGDALLTIRHEIPLLFEKDLTYDIYREDIVFRDPRNSFQGVRNYKILFWSLRIHGWIFFRKIGVEVKSVCQVSEREIRMRWCVHGIPRIPWEAEGIFDGVSIYKLDRHGKIYEHEVSNVIFRDPPVFRIPLLANLSLAPRRARQPCPGAWSLSLLYLIQRFSWVRMYLVVLMSMQLRNASGLAAPSS
ncbi:unnamed protein product [Ostreobium quekettii]|uniref:Uncharacterized protein n=1 Tax=Ostreobium quekettii TaxID=121088 RepID=A0A8S1JDG6_9CHLO|nr:unnamed protein product [Ostreobium quekettii]|eukprot:evm.model.scf_2491.2 EVM.evm.TU.scf_2491.2   scf_2491:5174-11079(-)